MRSFCVVTLSVRLSSTIFLSAQENCHLDNNLPDILAPDASLVLSKFLKHTSVPAGAYVVSPGHVSM